MLREGSSLLATLVVRKTLKGSTSGEDTLETSEIVALWYVKVQQHLGSMI
jgi:hypothetical protein